MINRFKSAAVIPLLVAAVATVGTGILVWSYAPMVGGEWWPYIRVLVTIFASIIVGKLSLIISQLIAIWYIGREIFSSGSEDSPWDDESVDDFMKNFDK